MPKHKNRDHHNSESHLMTERLHDAHLLMKRKSPETNWHLERVANTVRQMCDLSNKMPNRKQPFYNLDESHLAGDAHDLGKLKSPFLLNPYVGTVARQLNILKKMHVSKGRTKDIFDGAPKLVRDAGHYHHAGPKDSGKGYPKNVPANVDRFFNGLVRIADQFDTIVRRKLSDIGDKKAVNMDLEKREDIAHNILVDNLDPEYPNEPKVIDVFKEWYRLRRENRDNNRKNQKG